MEEFGEIIVLVVDGCTTITKDRAVDEDCDDDDGKRKGSTVLIGFIFKNKFEVSVRRPVDYFR